VYCFGYNSKISFQIEQQMRDLEEKREDQLEVRTPEEIQCLQIKELILLEVACSVQIPKC